MPRNQRVLGRPTLEELFKGVTYGDYATRNKIIKDAFKMYAYTQSEIAAFLEISRSAVSKVVCNTRQ